MDALTKDVAVFTSHQNKPVETQKFIETQLALKMELQDKGDEWILEGGRNRIRELVQYGVITPEHGAAIGEMIRKQEQAEIEEYAEVVGDVAGGLNEKFPDF